jgi:hypothetical protein
MKSTLMKKVEKVVQDIYKKNGEVKASLLVEAARPKESPAHPAFEWRDGVAAEEYRLYQARHLIRRVQVIHEDKPAQLVHVPIVSVRDESREGSYKPAEVIVEAPDEFEIALNAAIQRLKSARSAVDDLQRAANKLEHNGERSAFIAQVSNALAALNVALDQVVH